MIAMMLSGALAGVALGVAAAIREHERERRGPMADVEKLLAELKAAGHECDPLAGMPAAPEPMTPEEVRKIIKETTGVSEIRIVSPDRPVHQ